MICATYSATGEVLVVLPAPPDISGCALLIPTAADQANYPFSLSAADGSAVAFAIVLVWGAGFAGRACIRALFLGGVSSE
jgi:hypothetical protein